MPRLKFIVLTCVIASIDTCAMAQSITPSHLTTNTTALEGDYRTESSGPWNRDSTWARFTAGEWLSPARPPDLGAGTITVRDGHTVSIVSAVVYDQLIVESGGCVVVAAGIGHTLSDGPGNDLTILGTWLNRGGTWTILGSARWVVGDGGTFIQQTTSGISTPLSKASLSKGSTFIYRGGPSAVPASSFSGRTYGNLSFDSCGGSWTCTATGSSALLVTGSFSIGPGVKWSTGGFSGNITVQGATTLAGEWSGTGTGGLGVHTFAGRFEILSTGKYQLATTGSKQGAIVFLGDFKNDGLFSFPQNRQVNFSGEKAQAISGISATVFNNGFTLINRYGIVLESSITVDGSLVLGSGNVSTGACSLTLGQRGSVNEDTSSAIIGTIRVARSCSRDVNESFGNIGLEIKSLGNDPGLTEVTRVTGAPISLNGRNSIARYFDIQPAINVNLDAMLKFQYKDSELGVVNEAYLSLFRSTNDGSGWLPAGGEVDRATNMVCLDNINSFSRWTLGEFFPEPTLTLISPNRGSRGEAFDVLAEGSGFVPGGTGLAFSGAGITIEAINSTSTTELRAHVRISSDAPIGLRDVSITTPGGCATLRDCFHVEKPPNPAPILSRVRPTNGTRGQILTVTLEGSGLSNGMTLVTFGDSIEVLSLAENGAGLEARIHIAEGAGLGARNVAAVNPTPGGGLTVLRNVFSVLNPMPTLTSASPCEAALGDTVVVLLTGSGFVQEYPAVNFGDGIGVDSVIVVDRALLRVKVSISASTRGGPRDIEVTNPAPGGGTATLVDGFSVTYPAPKISSIIPSVCMRGKSALLTINGKDFVPGISTVSLPIGFRIDSIYSASSTQIVVAVVVSRGFAVGFATVTVTTPWPGGGSSSVAKRLEVHNPSPVITGIYPNRAVLGRTLEVVLTGSDFFDQVSSFTLGRDIAIHGISSDSNGTNLRAIIAVAESASVGERIPAVSNCGPGGGEAVLDKSFTVEYPIPSIASVSPAAASKGQTLDVILAGEGFVPGVTKTTFGTGVSVNFVQVKSRKNLIANIAVPSDAVVGARSVLVTNPGPGGGNAELRHVFNVEYNAPKLVRILPAVGVKGRKVVVEMEGSGFCEGATFAEFGAGIIVDSVKVKSQFEMNAYLSIGGDASCASRDVRVVNSPPGGGSETLKDAFKVCNPPPEVATVSPDRAERGMHLTVLIKGDRFIVGVTNVSFGADVSVAEVIVRNQNEIQAMIEIESCATPGPRSVTVMNEGQDRATAVLKDGFLIAPGTITLLEHQSQFAPDHYAIYQAFPNPFNPSTRIRFGLPERSRITIEVFNVLGNLIEKLSDDVLQRGYHEFCWNAAGFPSGVYILRLATQSMESERKMLGSQRVALIK